MSVFDAHSQKYHGACVSYIVIMFHYITVCTLDQINAALVKIRDFFHCISKILTVDFPIRRTEHPEWFFALHLRGMTSKDVCSSDM